MTFMVWGLFCGYFIDSVVLQLQSSSGIPDSFYLIRVANEL